MKTFKLDPEKFPRIQRNIILSYVLLALAGLGVTYLYIREALFSQAWMLIPFILLVFAIACWYAIRQRRKYWEEFRLTFQEDALIYHVQKSKEVRIRRSKINGVKEVRQGLILSTSERENTLLIPKDLPENDLQEVKRTLEEWAGQGD